MKNDGGPAFPHTLDMTAGGNERGGMSLRDYFAAAALTGIIAQNESKDPPGHHVYAREAYWYADAMLAERAKE